MKRCFRLNILFPIAGLGAISLLMIWSLAPNFLFRQSLSWLFGGAILFTATLIDWRRFFSLRFLLYLLVNAILILPILFGTIIRGSSRWINFGPFVFQPSETVKPLIILVLAFMAKDENFLARFKLGSSLTRFLALILMGLLPSFLIFTQPDLGSGLVIVFSLAVFGLGLAFLKRIRAWPLLLMFLGIVAISPLIWKHGLKSYQRERIAYFLNPKSDPLGKGYQSIQAEITFGSGKFFGNGLKRGGQSQLAFLPEKHTDFIFAAIGEELGYFGIIFLFGFYFLLFYSLIKLIFSSKDSFSFLLGIGIFSQLWFQAIVNMGMNMGIFPITGVTLPFVSYGGSSLFSLMLSLGMVFSTTCH